MGLLESMALERGRTKEGDLMVSGVESQAELRREEVL